MSGLRWKLQRTSREASCCCCFSRPRNREFDAITAEAQRGIELLHARRNALISAAVTGQINVRKPAGRTGR